MSEKILPVDLDLFRYKPSQMIMRLNKMIKVINDRNFTQEWPEEGTNRVLIAGKQPDGSYGLYYWTKAGDFYSDPTNVGGGGGSAGPTGATGPVGATGSIGFTGATGAGETGATGPQGVQGASGARGFTGATGIQGLQGASGTNGTNGTDGATGVQGPQGFTGPQGIQGFTGPQGIQGFTGPIGPTGVGATGATGVPGATGAQGVTGPVGAAGGSTVYRGNWTDGVTYSAYDNVVIDGSSYSAILGAVASSANRPGTGANWTTYWQLAAQAGITGATGPIGNTGASGVAGPTGVQGVTGPQGPQGFTGPAGATGVTGGIGATGIQGATGPAGTTGATGPARTDDTSFNVNMTGAIDGTNKVYTSPTAFSSILLFKNGAAMFPGLSNDYVVTSPTQVTFNTAPASNPTGRISAVITIADTIMIQGSNSPRVKQTVGGTKDNVNTTFTTPEPYIGGSLEVFRNGANEGSLVTESSPSTGTFTMDAAKPIDDLQCRYLTVNSVTGNADTVDGFNASATPTANTIPVLDSNAKLPTGSYPLLRARQGGTTGDNSYLTAGSSNTDTRSKTTFIQAGTTITTTNTSTANNGWFATAVESVTFPVPYTQVPLVVLTTFSDHSVPSLNSVSTTGFTYRARSVTNIASTSTVLWQSIGQ